MDQTGIAADGPNAVILTSSYPNSELPLLIRLTTFVLPENTADVAGAPGTGPFRLTVDREAMVAQALSGFGSIANDMSTPS